ncbi:hemicentin-2-like [Galendromus occidentalis]|uniref:Hemicentin-2-like n=1 Tax=Galendromus occidentalis TaxID=34638 RepID=A0AAJ7WIH7_9ACAR|nr:hemicentin-2-like [Galendromus occidentalis]
MNTRKKVPPSLVPAQQRAPGSATEINQYHSEENYKRHVGLRQLGVPPQIVPVKLSDDLEIGQRLGIVCSVRKGTQPITFQWRKDGGLLHEDQLVRISHNDDYQETLQILYLNSSHVGNYTCSTKNPYGSDQMGVRVILNHAPIWISNETSVSGVAGENVSLNCEASGHPTPIITMLKEGKAQQASPTGNGRLRIDPVKPGDAGTYTCNATNALGSITKTITLQLSGEAKMLEGATGTDPQRDTQAYGGSKMAPQEEIMLLSALCLSILFTSGTVGSAPSPPQIAQMKVPDPLEEGQRLVIVCAAVKGSLPISFSWRKDNAPLNSSSVRIVHSDDYQDQLQIDKLGIDHAANYTCSARNAFGSDQMSVSVNLNFAPVWVHDVPEIRSVPGESISIDCRVSASPTATIRISKGKLPLRNSHGVRVADGVLEISTVKLTDAGVYTCEASNDLGSIEKNILLSLNGEIADFLGVIPKWPTHSSRIVTAT